MADRFREVPPYAPLEESSEDEELNQDEGEEEEKDSDMDVVFESEDEYVSDWESDYKNPWEMLCQEARESLTLISYDKKVNTLLEEGALLPVYRKRL